MSSYPERVVLSSPDEVLSPYPERVVLPIPEELLSPYPERDVLSRPEVELSPYPDREVLSRPEEELSPYPELELSPRVLSLLPVPKLLRSSPKSPPYFEFVLVPPLKSLSLEPELPVLKPRLC